MLGDYGFVFVCVCVYSCIHGVLVMVVVGGEKHEIHNKRNSTEKEKMGSLYHLYIFKFRV